MDFGESYYCWFCKKYLEFGPDLTKLPAQASSFSLKRLLATRPAVWGLKIFTLVALGVAGSSLSTILEGETYNLQFLFSVENTAMLDFMPISNSLKFIFASPSMSIRLKIPTSSFFVAMCPALRKNLFKLDLSR